MRDGFPRRLSLTILLDAVVITSLTAQAEGSPVVLLPASTRSAGVGGAGAALVRGAGGGFANPAALAPIRHLSLEGPLRRSLPGATLPSAGMAVRLGPLHSRAGAAAPR